eukprot:Nitzschia sp. Nitz4//scaffold7_size249615//97276//97773//NITZ4_001166-RA/size249615-processed-gene-0.190-mRNA-1//-1//CDS//3329558409//8067//frame0
MSENTRKRASFNAEIITDVIEVPPVDPESHSELYYSKGDYQRFQEKEQARYDKMMSKHIQNLVREAMSDQIQEAMDRGATPEEVEAMMPQTTDEIFALIGGMPNLSMPAPPPKIRSETIHKTHEGETVPKPEASNDTPEDSAKDSDNTQAPMEGVEVTKEGETDS